MRVGSDDGEELSPVDHSGERHECDSGSIVQPAWPDIPLDVEGQLFGKRFAAASLAWDDQINPTKRTRSQRRRSAVRILLGGHNNDSRDRTITCAQRLLLRHNEMGRVNGRGIFAEYNRSAA
jgi:hypothetical protein